MQQQPLHVLVHVVKVNAAQVSAARASVVGHVQKVQVHALKAAVVSFKQYWVYPNIVTPCG